MTRKVIWQASRVAHAGVAGAAALCLVQLPWAGAGGSLLAFILFLPLSAGCATVAALVLGTLALTRPARRFQALIALTASGIFGVAGVAGNLLLVDPPTGGYTLLTYALGVVLATLAAWVIRRRLLASAKAGPLALAVLLAGAGLTLAILDCAFAPFGYRSIHWGLCAAALTFLCAADLTYRQPSTVQSNAAHAGAAHAVLSWGSLALILALFAALSAGGIDRMAEFIARHPTSQRRALIAARAVVDADGDGFSPVLAGADCDDEDPATHPLSVRGFDCLRWGDAAAHAPPAPEIAKEAVAHDGPALPRVVVLLTIDAFRCGFRERERPEFHDICPKLTQLAAEGIKRLDAYATFPATLESVRAMNRAGEGTLGKAMEGRGYHTRLVATHQYVTRAIGAHFAAVDTELVPSSADSGATADRVSERVWDALTTAPRSERSFIWAHYFDAHAPYVSEAGEHLRRPDFDQYVAEIRRVDAAIGHLVEQMRALGDEAVVFITADHGEEFDDEHGRETHGSSLYDQAIRVPLIVWRGGRHNGEHLGRPPQSLEFLGDYILSVVDGAALQGRAGAFFSTNASDDVQFGVAADGWKLIYHEQYGYSELYDVVNDPLELVDRFEDNPTHRGTLGALLARGLRQRASASTAPSLARK